MFFFAYSFPFTGTGFNISDIRVGLFDSNALVTGSTETTIVAAMMGDNHTSYKHYVTTITPAGSDTVNEQMSGSFRIATATNLYPWFRLNQNTGGGISVIFDLTITRIG